MVNKYYKKDKDKHQKETREKGNKIFLKKKKKKAKKGSAQI